MKKLVAIVLTVAVLLSITACGGKTDKTSGKNSKELNIYMWQSYISDDLIKNFEKKYDCKVNLSYMSDNADSITKLTAGLIRSLYDVISIGQVSSLYTI